MEKRTSEIIVKVYAVLAWITAIIAALGGLALLFGGTFIAGMMNAMFNTDPLVMSAGAGLITVFGVVALVVAVFYAITGTALWQGKNWARVCAIIYSVLELFSFPVGTIIGVFGIWLFGFEPNTRAMFGVRNKKASAPAKKRKR